MGKFKNIELERLYSKQMGIEATERQIKAAKKVRGKCVCETRLVKKRWDGETLSVKTIHEQGCPKWRWWMSETDRL